MIALDASECRHHYPMQIEGDLRDCGLTEKGRREVLATAWEYVRCEIPEFTNWEKYITFVCLTALTTMAEYRGDVVYVDQGDEPGRPRPGLSGSQDVGFAVCGNTGGQ
ncbi:hypothetical protein ACWD7F_35695 [Streptomyces sp. NPDC005122]